MKKPRILQVFTFYEAYTQAFYARHPELSARSYEAQLEALYEDGFSGIHIYSRHLRDIGHDATFVVANCSQLQIQWLRQYGKRAVDPHDWMNEVLRQQIEHFDPEVLYILNPIQFDSKLVRSLSKRPKLVMGWRAAEIPPGTDWRDFDLIVSHLSVCRERALQLGAKAVEPFQPAVSEELENRTKDITPTTDVVFSGQWTAQHETRNKLLAAVARDAADKGYSIGLFLAGATDDLPPEVKAVNRGPVFGMDMYRALRSGRIVLNAEINLARGEAGNMRLFETTGAGSFLLTQHHDNIGEYFEPGKEIETFRSTEELLEKISFYLAHIAEREAIAAAGLVRCHKDHSMWAWAARLSDMISRYI